MKKNPFATIDQTGVGQLVEIAVDEGPRRRGPNIKLGICGEHGGDPASIQFFEKVGLDYVSCSPYRVPVARLAAAQAALQVEGRGLITRSTSTRTGPPERVDRVDPAWLDAGQRRLRLGRPRRARRRTKPASSPTSSTSTSWRSKTRSARSTIPKVESYGDYLYLILHGIDFKASEHAFRDPRRRLLPRRATTW